MAATSQPPFGLVKLLLLENLVLGIAATALGLGLAFVLIETLGRSLLRGGYLERIFWIDVQLDLRAAGFAVACGLVASCLGALAPIVSTTLRARFGDSGDTRTRTASRSRALVSLQVGLCFALLVAAGLWSSKAHELLGAEPGFRSTGLSSIRLSAYQADLGEPSRRRELFERIRRDLGESPGVQAAAYASSTPWGFVPRSPVADAALEPDRESAPRAEVIEVSPGFFATLELDLQAGRPFTVAEATAGNVAGTVAIISRSLADRMFQTDALDRALTVGGPANPHDDRESSALPRISTSTAPMIRIATSRSTYPRPIPVTASPCSSAGNRAWSRRGSCSRASSNTQRRWSVRSTN